jgi:hypothetical protein
MPISSAKRIALFTIGRFAREEHIALYTASRLTLLLYSLQQQTATHGPLVQENPQVRFLHTFPSVRGMKVSVVSRPS